MTQKYNSLPHLEQSPAQQFGYLLKANGTAFATGIPCGVLKDFIKMFSADVRFMHMAGQNEPECIGIAAGAYLAGELPVIYMQNSGLLKSSNELCSLLLPYQIPSLLLASFRGCPGEDAPQHFFGGQITLSILDSLGIHHRDWDNADIKGIADDCYLRMRTHRVPTTILVRKDSLNDACLPKNVPTLGPTSKALYANPTGYGTNPTQAFERVSDLRTFDSKQLTRELTIDAVKETSEFSDAIIVTTGLMSRSLFERNDSPNQFYCTGAFGLASSIGAGFSFVRPELKVFVIDGDASLLSNFSSLVTIGKYAPRGLIHIVVDNGAYASCSEERSCSSVANIPLVATLQGYTHVYLVDSLRGLSHATNEARKQNGPTMVYASISLGGRRNFARPLDLPNIAYRFRNHFQKSSDNRRPAERNDA